MADWNPELYLQFESERIQPSIDLISRIPLAEPKSIIDIGCGPGNSTQILANRWPNTNITGLDNSPAMIKKANQDYPAQNWIVADASNHNPGIKYDLVFSNAAIHWLPDHQSLLSRFCNWLPVGGVLAVQLPLRHEMASAKIVENTANQDRWKAQIKGASDRFTVHNYAFYYDILSELFTSINLWETHYVHIFENHLSILEMIKSTSLKPYLGRLKKDAEKLEFEAGVLNGIEKAYPLQKNGRVLFPFKRLFFIGQK
ncbi:MAG: methyltransferase domain-containing protein [Proteobacteria bacterium]|nr:methyltransferase domain-containing protein [Pseudomonadota bacterium]